MRIELIRHGKTLGNEKKLFVGRLDECLSENGISEILELKSQNKYTQNYIIYSSPMKRCIQTAEIIFGKNNNIKIIDNLREMDFGIFDGKSFDEVTSDPSYADFGSSEEKMYFPNGENLAEFKQRCISALKMIIDKSQNCTIVCHGGVIMALMEWISSGKMKFYDGMCSNAEGFIIEIENENISYYKL